MKHVLLTILFIAISGLTLASCSTSDDGQSPSATQKSIAILFEGDTHCEVGGYSLFAGLRDAMQHADTAHVVTVSLGDFMVGGVLGNYSNTHSTVRTASCSTTFIPMTCMKSCNRQWTRRATKNVPTTWCCSHTSARRRPLVFLRKGLHIPVVSSSRSC